MTSITAMPGLRNNRTILLVKLRTQLGRNVFWQPSYGLAVLARYVTEHTDWTVRMCDDAQVTEAWDEHLRSQFEEHEPSVVGLSLFSCDIPRLDSLWSSQTLSSFMDRGGRVLIGGPHASTMPEEVTRFPGSIFVCGEGEQTTVELLRAFENGDPIDHIPGIAFARDGSVVRSKPREFLAGEEIPSPLWPEHGVLSEKWHPLYDMARRVHGVRSGQVMYSRGCTFRCEFCHSVFGKRVRRRPVDVVVKEMEDAVRDGATEFNFLDDLLISNRKSFYRLMDAIADANLGLPISFWNGVRADLATPKDLEKMYAAGGRHILLPVESASTRILELMNKPLDLKKVREAWRVAREIGFIVQTNLIFGWPGATAEDLRADVDFVRTEDLHAILVLRPAITANSGLYRQAVAQKPRVEHEWQNYSGQYMVHNLTECSDQVFFELLGELESVVFERVGCRETRERMRVFHLEPNPDYLNDRFKMTNHGPQEETVDTPAAVAQSSDVQDHEDPSDPNTESPIEFLPRAELDLLVAPLQPQRPLRNGWKVGQYGSLDGWPVVQFEGPREGQQIRLQIVGRGTVERGYAHTRHFMICWLADHRSKTATANEVRLVDALVSLIRKNERSLNR